MGKEFFAILGFQGEVRMVLMRYGLNQEQSLNAAGEVVELLMKSDLPTQEIKDTFTETVAAGTVHNG